MSGVLNILILTNLFMLRSAKVPAQRVVAHPVPEDSLITAQIYARQLGVKSQHPH